MLKRTFASTLLLTLLLCVGATAVAQDNDDPVVIQIGRTLVTQSEFNERFLLAVRNIAAQQGIPFSNELLGQLQDFRPNFLDQLAVEMVLLEEADMRGVSISSEEIDEQIDTVKANLGSDEAFAQVLAQAGFENETQLRRLIRENTLIERVVEQVRDDITVSDEAVESFYADNPEFFATPEEVCARHILVETLEEAEAVLAALDEGEEFAALAQERSIDTGSGTRGGDLGCFGRGMMVPPFEEAAFDAELDSVSEPVESQFGFHIITVYDRNEADVIPLEEVRDQVAEQLADEQLSGEIDRLRAESGIEIFAENLGPIEIEEEDFDLLEEEAEEDSEDEDSE